MGNKVFGILEDSECCDRSICPVEHSFIMNVTDISNQEVIRLVRPFVSCCGTTPVFQLEVQNPPGNPIGYVMQNWHPFLPKFTIQNERKESVGPFCECKCCSDVIWGMVMSLDKTSVIGRISKQLTGFEAEAFTDADNFGLQFPMDLDAEIKAVVLGGCFLIDFMYFEHTQKQE
uniref:Phospholipid scramblase n=1 Tax=Cyprinus carpio TaxID=7962 RepID=A0A8C1SY09_CYPCA